MFKVAVYIDGPTVPDRTDNIRMTYLFDSDASIPTDIIVDGSVKYSVKIIELTDILYNGEVLDFTIFRLNFNKFKYVNNALEFISGDLVGMDVTGLERDIPLSLSRANTVVNFEKL